MSKGFLAIILGNHRLYGKIEKLDQHGVDIEHFLSVASREVQNYPIKAVAHAHLPKQTRVFLNISDNYWRVGRVISSSKEDDGSFTYSVRFPNGIEKDIGERDLFVRCLDEFADPADILATGCAETQYFADRRRLAKDRLLKLRASAQGLTAVLSSNVEIVPHQLAAVRRVLTDSLQRYLLADEVGLGKTIEAGLILRQLLIDGRIERAIILAPDGLVDQWSQELRRRFHIDEFLSADVRVVAHSDIQSVVNIDSLDLLIIDEAHRMLSKRDSADPSQSEAAASMASAARRLLLLSATPELADESRFLALLSLLDPASFPSDRPDDFHRKVVHRQDIGRFLLAFRPGVHPFVLKQQAQKALELFPADQVIADASHSLLSAAAAGGALDDYVNDIRDHVARTYRIHQRVIRTRRRDAEGWALRPRGPALQSDGASPLLSHVRLEFDQDERNLAAWNLIETWRDGAIVAIERMPSLRDAILSRVLELHSIASAGVDALARSVSTFAPLFEQESEIFTEIARLCVPGTGPSPRQKSIAQGLLDWRKLHPMPPQGKAPPKICCFCSDDHEAEHLAAYLQAIWGRGFVATIDKRDSMRSVSAFEKDKAQWVLVCPREFEEGLNLQFVHSLFHVDVPFSPPRMEQRVGRLDRFGRRLSGVSHRVLLPVDDDDSPWRIWFELLANAFALFNQSVSDIQFMMDRLERRIAEGLLMEGAAGLSRLGDQIRVEISEERQKLDEQFALDSLALSQDIGAGLATSIEGAEEDEDQIAQDVAPWLSHVIGIGSTPTDDGPDLVSFNWNDDVLIPATPWKNVFRPALARPSTWKRLTALRTPGSVLLRPGSTLVDALERVGRWDDRGIAYSTWRCVPAFSGTWRGFRLVWTIEHSIQSDGSIHSELGDSDLRRLADGFLAPIRIEQVIDESLAVVTERALLELVKRPYSNRSDTYGRRDFNLGSRPGDLTQEMESDLFQKLVGSVRDFGRSELQKDAALQSALATAVSSCIRDVSRARASLRQQLAMRTHGSNEDPLFQVEIERLDRLVRSVESPRITLDELGFIIISPNVPSSRVAKPDASDSAPGSVE